MLRVHARPVTSHTGPAGVILTGGGGGGGVRKRGMSDCPFVDPRVNNSNLVKISHLPGLRKIKGFMCVIKLLYLFP